jgi:CubicO group peptidase (beta-lactamase class C family)
MIPSRYAFVLTSIYATGVLSDFLGPTYPAPIDLTSDDSLVAAGWKNLSSTLEAYLGGSDGTETQSLLNDLAFSIGMFSTLDPNTAESLQYHHTSPEIANASTGVNEVDADSIYRVASVSKLFTVYAGMIELSSEEWDLPLTEVIPGLKKPEEKDATMQTQWDKITPAALASQMGGVPRDAMPFAFDLLLFNETESVGLPPLNMSDPAVLSPCTKQNLTSTCPGDLYVEGLQTRSPIFLPWAGPAYANNGFTMLGLALAHITGKSLDTIYSESIFEPLGMTSSSSVVPDKADFAKSVIPGDPISAVFDFDNGISESSGGIFSTINDLAKFGTSILDSTLLPEEVTRKWMKPVSHTAHLQYSIGRPWEIYRYVHSSGKVTDMYTKLGDSGQYGGYIILVPEYNAGFSVLGSSSSETRSPATQLVTDVLTETILPALEAQAEREACRNFAGTYSTTVDGEE